MTIFMNRRLQKIMRLNYAERETALRAYAQELGCSLSSSYTADGKHLEEEIVRRILEAMRSIRESRTTWAAFFIALCSLIYSLYGGYEDRRYKRLSVRPELQYGFYYTKDKGAGWSLWNSGLGPARIKWFEVTVDGQPKKNWPEVVSSFKFPPSATKINYQMVYPVRNLLIKSGDSNHILWFEDETLVEAVKQNHDRVKMNICYCSLYNECWETNFLGVGSVESSCKEIPPVIFGTGLT